MDDSTLLAEARRVAERAYAPYSKLRVGCALLTDDGRVFSGCNVENVSYGLTICAERSAICSAVAAGAQRIARIALWSSSKEVITPCGACRQVLAEFSRHAGGRVPIVMESAAGEVRTRSVAELLPDAFTEDAWK